MVIISVINNKGGVGKTTIVQNLAIALARKKLRVALIDFDPQANLSNVFEQRNENGPDLVSVISSSDPINTETFRATYEKNVFILPNLKDINTKLFNKIDIFTQNTLLKSKLIQGEPDFDFILIDTPPSLELQTVNALTASDYILIPIEYEAFSIDGIDTVKAFYSGAKNSGTNPKLEILGVLATHVDKRLNITDEMLKELQTKLGNYLFKTEIRTSSMYREAQKHNKNIFNFKPKLNPFGTKKCVEDFESLANEILKRLKK